MSDPNDTVWMQGCVDRLRKGESDGADELIRRTCGRLERIARRMLVRFPDVLRWEQAEDVLQNGLVRLTRSLSEIRPNSMREFYNLAAVQIRRELLDLARRYRSPLSFAANHDSRFDTIEPSEARSNVTAELDRWAAFHSAVEELPAEEREVIGLVFYHGWNQARIAELFDVSERTIRRWWVSGCERIRRRIDPPSRNDSVE